MDGVGAQRDSRSSHRQSPHPRPASRSSTATSSTANTQMTPRSMESGSSHRQAHARQNNPHPVHKFHHSRCGSGGAPTSRLSKDILDEVRQTPVSSFLQERLQRERKAESDRAARRMSGAGLSSSIGDMRDRDMAVSPTRQSATAMGRRPRSNSGEESANKGMGLKEMEQTVSSLHKQNFDLKLELYHRRERQNVLEEKVIKLEKGLAEMTEVNDSLVLELEKRDRAVGEAVAMISRLESTVEELLREREMVRQVEADGSYRHSRDDRYPAPRDRVPTPRARDVSATYSIGDKVLDRMPSFLSERSEHTANLRHVLLNNKNSLLHMRKVSESSADGSEINRVVSPSFSLLSESSFVSVYGPKDDQSQLSSPPLPSNAPLFDDDGMDGSPTPGKRPSKESWGNQRRSNTPSRMPKGPAKGGTSLSMQSLNNILDKNSPLQELAMLDRRNINPNSPVGAKPSRPAAQIKTKQEKRDALRKVLTTSPEIKELRNSQALPPTPDTISTSTLRRFQNSNDTLCREERLTPHESFVNDNTSSRSHQNSDAHASRQSHNLAPPDPSSPGQPASMTAFTGRKNLVLGPPIDTELFANFHHISQSLPRRPRSAGETTTSRARDSWASESDSDGGADACWDDNNFDPWMRESNKPNTHAFHLSMPRPKGAGQIRSPSPDLFSFPMNGGAWETDAMLGAMREAGFMESPVSALKRDPIDEFDFAQAVAKGLVTPQTAMFQPPAPQAADGNGGVMPPNRRSSLHARTGSLSRTGSLTSNVIPPVNGRLRKSPVKSGKPNGSNVPGGKMRRVRSNSIDSAVGVPPTMMQMDGQGGNALAKSGRSQYPPIAGQQASGRSRGLGGLNSLFKRGGHHRNNSEVENGSMSVPASATEMSFPPQHVQQVQVEPPRQVMPPGRCSVPPPPTSPWSHSMPVNMAIRAVRASDDDLSSATPPPIMRSRAPPPPISAAAGVEADASGPATPLNDSVVMEGGAGTPGTPHADGTPNTGGRRRWLGLGRMTTKKGNATSG